VRRVGPYARATVELPVRLVGVELLGSASREPGIDLYIQNIRTVEELFHVLAHEVVHHVDPDLNEGATDAKATWLANRPGWVGPAAIVLVHGLFRLVRALLDDRTPVVEVRLAEEVIESCRSESTTRERERR